MAKFTDHLQNWCNNLYGWVPQPRPRPEQLKNTRLIAHRGAWNNKDILENTIESFQRCLNNKVWAIEFDIRWTSDNIAVVHHDESTQRVFAKKLLIHETSFKTLRQQIPQIPTFSEIIEQFSGRIHFMIELKTLCTPKQVLIIKNLLNHLEPITDYHFMSLDPQRFSPIDFAPKESFVSIGLTNVYSIYKKTLSQHYGGFTGHYFLINNKMKQQCQKRGIIVGTGFPHNKNLLYREVRRGIPWIFTNKALDLAKWL